MVNQKYERLGVFREATMRNNNIGEPSQSKAAPSSRAAFNYKPTILRTLSLLSLFVVTIALIGLLQYAVIELPHGTSTRRDRLPGSSAAKRDVPLLYARQASNSSGSAVTSASLPSITSSSVTSAAITLTTAESAYLATDTTQTLSSTTAQAFTSNGFLVATSNYVPTDATETVHQTSANTLFAVSQSDYVNAGTTQTVSLKSTIASSVGQSNYASTDATQTVQTIAYSAAPSQYVSTDATQTITPSTSYTTVPSATVINVPVTATSQITSWTQAVSLTTVPSHTLITMSGSLVDSWTQVVSATTIPVYTVINVAVSGSGSTQITSWTQAVSAVIPGATATPQVSLTTVPSKTVIMIPATAGTGSTQVTSWTQVVSAVTLGASSHKLSFTTVPSYTVINIPNTSGPGSTFVTSWTQVVETIPPSGTAAATGGSSQATATPADNAASSEDTYGKGATILRYSWNTEQTFLGTYLAVLIAVIYRMFWTVINNNFNLIEPFRQLNESNGAVAERALFSFYQAQSTLLGPVPALLKRRWALALVGTTYLVTCVMPALGSEAIYVDTDWGCANPMEGPNPCQARMTADVTILRILQVLLAFAALALLLLISLLLLTKTGLPANPSSMATVASLMRNPALLDDEIPPDADAKHMRDALAGRRYKLDAYKTATGELGYGIVPAYGNSQDEQNHVPGYSPLAGVATSSRSHSHRFRLTDLVLGLAVLGIFGVVLAYYLDGKHDGFNDYFSSNTFGPRFILTFAATIVASLWKTVEQSAVIIAPYTRLAHHQSSAKSTILFTPQNTPFLATLTAIWNRYFLVAIITFVTLTAEGLNIVISGVPYATGQTWTQFLVSIYMSLGILGLMVAVSVLVILSRRREPKMPRKPDTVGAVMSYLSTSKMLHDFEGVDWQDGEERDRRIRLVGKRYTFLQRRREGGKEAWSVDEVYE
ncbi:hypothetical protein LTS09_006275 [Friedmanniomyces endolithicus]|nr:hypothetical protein LTS09_006275 [Friedmanniomyces endolithicus]